MATTKFKSVEMAKPDPANATRFVTEMKDVEVVRINVRLRDTVVAGRVFTDVACGGVFFKPGEVKSLEITAVEATRIRNRREGPWEIVPASGGKQ